MRWESIGGGGGGGGRVKNAHFGIAANAVLPESVRILAEKPEHAQRCLLLHLRAAPRSIGFMVMRPDNGAEYDVRFAWIAHEKYQICPRFAALSKQGMPNRRPRLVREQDALYVRGKGLREFPTANVCYACQRKALANPHQCSLAALQERLP